MRWLWCSLRLVLFRMGFRKRPATSQVLMRQSTLASTCGADPTTTLTRTRLTVRRKTCAKVMYLGTEQTECATLGQLIQILTSSARTTASRMRVGVWGLEIGTSIVTGRLILGALPSPQTQAGSSTPIATGPPVMMFIDTNSQQT